MRTPNDPGSKLTNSLDRLRKRRPAGNSIVKRGNKYVPYPGKPVGYKPRNVRDTDRDGR